MYEKCFVPEKCEWKGGEHAIVLLPKWFCARKLTITVNGNKIRRLDDNRQITKLFFYYLRL